jgi:peroxiredoxin
MLPRTPDLSIGATVTTATTITARVAEMHAGQAEQPPNKVKAAFGRERAELAAAGRPDGIAAAGTLIADTELLDPHGAPTTLYRATGSGGSVLVFYRGAWCPYCNIALATYQAHLLPQLTQRGITLVAVSPQAPDGSLTMAETNALTFTVVSDPGNTIATQIGIVTAPSADARAAQLKLGLDLTAVNADATVTLPMPATAILDADHVLRWIDVHPDYGTRTEPQQILDALDQLPPT